ncbi:TPA: hypothetical protein ACL5I0_000643 [Streptococcus pneumoniae]
MKFKEFLEHERKEEKSVGILSIILGLLFPIVGLILGIIGLVLAISYQKESQLDYKIEKILNILGIVISVVNWIVAIALIFR